MATLLMTFMAVTSTLSAQVIAVSSIVAFDGYRTYFNRSATNKEVILWSRIGVILFGLVAAGLTALFHYVGIDMGWTLYMIGTVEKLMFTKYLLTGCHRSDNLPRDFSTHLVDSLEKAKSSGGHCIRLSWAVDRPRCLAWHSSSLLWFCHCFFNRTNTSMHVRHNCICIQPCIILGTHHIVRAGELRLDIAGQGQPGCRCSGWDR